ncbi:MAG TPA: hypothetical protein VGT81_09265, partial [Casimicrobiaceae bacterium]|nr:hypothetical protein [Casimicrobiaceae bacterium]
GVPMMRSLILRTSAALASATLAFLVIAPVAAPLAQGKTMNFPDACSITIDGSGNMTMTCGAPPPPGALTCSILGAPSGQVAPNTPISLAMSCTGGTTPYRYLWSPGGGTSATLATNVAATTTFSVTATDAANVTSTQSVTVTVSSGGGGPGYPGFCNQYPVVLPVVNATWGQQSSMFSTASGNFGDNTVWVIKLVVPPGTPNSSIIGRFTTAEYQGPNTFRQLTISTQACDFRQKDYTGVNGPLAVSNGTTAEVSYGVATPFIFGPAGLSAGQTYYINVRNWQLDPTPQNSCGMTTCNAIMNNIPATP